MISHWMDTFRLNKPDSVISLYGIGIYTLRKGRQRIIPPGKALRNFWSFIFVHDPLDVLVDGERESLPANTLSVWAPGSKTVDYGESGQTWHISWIQPYGEAVDGLLRDLAFPVDRSFHFQDARLVFEHYLSLFNEFQHYKRPDERILLSNFRTILLEALRTLEGKEANARRRVPAPRLLEARHFIESHYSEGFDLVHLAKTACLSPEHFCRRFRAEFGMPPMDYMMDLRISEVARRLVDAEIPIHQIALDAGFRNMANFSKTFRRRFGASPLEYRRSLLRR